MKKIITLNLFKSDRLENEYKDIKAIEKDSEYIFSLDGVKTVFGPTRFTRETEEYKFSLDIKERKASYLLKDKNMSFDIDVEKVVYKKEKNIIILEYKISSDEETFKIEINEEDDINE
jgi:trehalose/maltose hydrolase-like predicted phosphorylase